MKANTLRYDRHATKGIQGKKKGLEMLKSKGGSRLPSDIPIDMCVYERTPIAKNQEDTHITMVLTIPNILAFLTLLSLNDLLCLFIFDRLGYPKLKKR